MKNKNNSIIYFKLFLIVAVIILLFSAVDYFFHTLNVEYSVPDYYFRNKIIFGIIWGFLACLVLRMKRFNLQTWSKSLIFSAIVSIFLQVRYYLEGYSLDFVILFLFIHFFILLILSYLAFRLFKKIV